MPAPITPCLWFDQNAEEAAALYTSVFPGSRITSVQSVPGENPFPGPLPASRVLALEVDLGSTSLTLLNGGPMFTFSEATSLQVECADQAEIDHYWNGLIANGGSESACGWLKDPFGFSWQIVWRGWRDLASSGSPAQVAAAQQALMGMREMVVADLESAWRDAG